MCNNPHEKTPFFPKLVNIAPPIEHYTLINYYSYLLYPPLFIHGPILGFHCWLAQINVNRFSIKTPWKKIFIYALKIFFCLIVFEIYCHVLYPNALLIIPPNEPIYYGDFYLTFILGVFFFFVIL